MKKKILFVIFCMTALCLLVSGCKKKEEGNDEQTLLLGFSQLGSESAWRIGNTKDIEDVAAGFGVSDPVMAKRVAKTADGVVMGSAFVRIQLDGDLSSAKKAAKAQKLAADCRSAPGRIRRATSATAPRLPWRICTSAIPSPTAKRTRARRTPRSRKILTLDSMSKNISGKASAFPPAEYGGKYDQSLSQL